MHLEAFLDRMVLKIFPKSMRLDAASVLVATAVSLTFHGLPGMAFACLVAALATQVPKAAPACRRLLGAAIDAAASVCDWMRRVLKAVTPGHTGGRMHDQALYVPALVAAFMAALVPCTPGVPFACQVAVTVGLTTWALALEYGWLPAAVAFAAGAAIFIPAMVAIMVYYDRHPTDASLEAFLTYAGFVHCVARSVCVPRLQAAAIDAAAAVCDWKRRATAALAYRRLAAGGGPHGQPLDPFVVADGIYPVRVWVLAGRTSLELQIATAFWRTCPDQTVSALAAVCAARGAGDCLTLVGCLAGEDAPLVCAFEAKVWLAGGSVALRHRAADGTACAHETRLAFGRAGLADVLQPLLGRRACPARQTSTA